MKNDKELNVSFEDNSVKNNNLSDFGWYKEAKKSKNKEKWNPNPWAVCTESVGRDDPKKYERCVRKIKKQQG